MSLVLTSLSPLSTPEFQFWPVLQKFLRPPASSIFLNHSHLSPLLVALATYFLSVIDATLLVFLSLWLFGFSLHLSFFPECSSQDTDDLSVNAHISSCAQVFACLVPSSWEGSERVALLQQVCHCAWALRFRSPHPSQGSPNFLPACG